MNHVLDSFPILNNYLKEKVNFKITNQNLYYHNEKKIEQKLTLTPTNETEKITILDDEYGQWNPLENDLYYHMQVQLENKNILFDNNIGIASKDAILGLAITWFCKSTNQIKTIHLQEITYESNQKALKCECNLCFKPGELAKQLGYQFVLYVKKGGKNTMFAQNSGTILGTLEEHYINLEGIGSIFPIQIYEEEKGPLWRVEFNYTDIYEDLFEKENICLYLNKLHQNFFAICAETENKLSPLLQEILANFFVLFIQDIKEKGYDITQIAAKTYDEENTIAKVVNYWIKYLQIDTSSANNLSLSVRKKINLL